MDWRRLTTLATMAVMALWPAAAAAQSAIGGLVRDNTGGALPGATVEAASPALIEGSRVAVTDGQGRYLIVNLEPGVYTVTFTQPGFSKVVRQGIELPSSFTATVDATLAVGALAETVTVSGASPIVDVQQTQRTQVLSRQVLDAIPTGRNTWTQAMLVAGVAMTGTDVGGSQHVSDLLLEAHGANAQHAEYTVDGLKVNTLGWNALGQNYYQDQANQEMSIQTGGGNAENMAGGVRLDMIPKDGGNTFKGTGYLGGSPGAWQSDNFSQELKDTGLQSIDRIDRIFDYNGSLGGPIFKDRLWFFGTIRLWGVWNPVADTFLDNGKPYRSEAQIWAPIVRLTYQATARDKFALHFDRQAKSSGPKLTATYPAIITGRGTDPETARLWQSSTNPYYVAQAKWTSSLSSRLLVDAGYSASSTLYKLRSPIGVAAIIGTPEWYSRVQKRDLDLGVTWNAVDGSTMDSLRHLVKSSVSYVTGSHNVKVGTELSWGSFTTALGYDLNGHLLRQQYRSGVPDSAIVTNYPVFRDARVSRELGIFAQDSWKVRRLTVNGGVRLDWLNAYVNDQTAAAGRFVPERHFAKIANVPDWGPDVAPRFGVAYDLFGNAKTALKFSFGKYATPLTTAFAERFNPMAGATASLPWNDRDLQNRILPTNGDDIVQDNEIDLRRLPTNFGERQLDRLDPNIRREYNLETAVSVQHALLRNVSVSAGWYRRSFHNLTNNDNLERDFSDYRPVEIVSPYNGEVITVYDLKNASELALVDTLVTNASEGREQVYNGFEFALEARLSRGGTFLASSTTQHTVTSNCDEVDDPNNLRFCDRFNLPAPYNGVPFRSDLKLAGSYPLPGGLHASARFTSTPGRNIGDLVRIDDILPITWSISRTTRYTAEGCAGRPCTPGDLVIPGMVLTSLTVPLAPTGTERFYPRLNQLDLGVRKTFRRGRVSLEPSFEVFNALNADTVVAERSASFGTPAYALPSQVLLGRLPRVSVLMKW